ncbi:MAG: ParB/RepB/Spo0J family partition protein [Clostridiales bacterium]|jgi:ParB family chromosome partitioning protein|nr:ParB/RepB/Spo0J family partition protein [Clostridiales bacterium]
MTPKKGLGRGLGALLNTEEAERPAADGAESVLSVDINKIEPNKDQPRKRFSEEAIAELAASVAEHGVLSPILARERDGVYVIIAGERRWRAARQAGLTRVPVLVKDFGDAQTLSAALIENLQREDLSPVEEAEGYKRLMEEFFMRQEDVAAKVGKSRSAVSYALALLNLDPRVREFIACGRLSPAAGRALLRIEDAEVQFHAAERVIEEELSAKAAEKLVKALLSPKGARTGAPGASADYSEIENDMRRILGTKFAIKETQGKEKGRIEIEYYSHEELERILGFFR